MKKIIVLAITAVFAVSFTASAQKTTVTRVNREKAYQTTVVPKMKQPIQETPRQKTVWYQGEVALGLAVGNGTTGPIVETVHGIHISKYAFVGAGIGLHYPVDYGDPLVPLFADFKFYYPVNNKIAPFLNIDAGYEVCEAGTYFGVGIGLKYKRWQFSVGVRGNGMYDDNDYYYSSYYYEEPTTRCYGFLKIGFTF